MWCLLLLLMLLLLLSFLLVLHISFQLLLLDKPTFDARPDLGVGFPRGVANDLLEGEAFALGAVALDTCLAADAQALRVKADTVALRVMANGGLADAGDGVGR